jgi:hypothetical protein
MQRLALLGRMNLAKFRSAAASPALSCAQKKLIKLNVLFLFLLRA